MSKKSLLTAAALVLLPLTVFSATYDDLINSAKMGDTKEVAQIVAKGASIDSTDIEGNTLLMLAARDGHVDTVVYQINARAKINARNSAGDNALRRAAFRGPLKVVEALVAGGAAVNSPGWTPLAYAAFNGQTEIAAFLIKAGADVNAASENGTTPLIAAARGGHIEIAKALLASKADPSKALDTGETAVDVALRYQNTDIADLIRTAGGRSGRSVTIELR